MRCKMCDGELDRPRLNSGNWVCQDCGQQYSEDGTLLCCHDCGIEILKGDLYLDENGSPLCGECANAAEEQGCDIKLADGDYNEEE